MACIFTYIHIYIKLKNNQEKYSFQCFKVYCFQKFTLKKDHINFTLQSNCLSDVSFITMFALFNAFSNYFLAQELFRIKNRASATLNSPAGSHRRQHFHSPTNAHSFLHQLAAAFHGGGGIRRRSFSRGLVIGLISGFGILSVSETARVYLPPGLEIVREDIFAQP